MRIRLFVAAAGITLLGNCASADAVNIIVGNPLLNTSNLSVGCGLSPQGCTFRFHGVATASVAPRF